MAADSPTPRPRRFSHVVLLASALIFASPMIDAGVASATVEGQRAEVQRIVDQLEALHEQADVLAEEYAIAADEELQLQGEIAKAEERLAAKEAELATLQGDLAEVAVRAYTGAGEDVLGPLFSDAAEYSDALQRDQYSRVALDVGTGTTDDLDELIRDIDEERDDLESKRERQAQLKEEIAAKQIQVDDLTEQYTTARAEAEAKLGRLIEEEEARRNAEALARIQAEAAAANANANANAGNNGGGGNGGDQGGNDDGGGDQGGNDDGGGDQGGNGGGGGDQGGNDGGGGGGGSSYVPPVSGLAGAAIQAAMSQRGKPYRYATAGPDSYDCSGLTHYAWGAAGIYLPRNSRAQAAATPEVPISAAQPGDLIFYYSPISHVGIYLGDGMLVHAPATGDVVKVVAVSWNKVTRVGRPG